MRRVIIESPFAGATPELAARNARYLAACIRDCALRGDSPYASHRMLPGALDDNDPTERALGLELGFWWRMAADATIFYHDLGFSNGMRAALIHIARLAECGFEGMREIPGRKMPRGFTAPVEYRLLGGEWDLGLSEQGRP